MINPNGDHPNFRQEIKRNHPKKQILVIDEVDVFFSCSFYGKTYNLAVKFKDPLISKIIHKIWEIGKPRGVH